MSFLFFSALLGCHVFDSGLIEQNCTDLNTCDLFGGVSVLLRAESENTEQAEGWQVVVLDADGAQRFSVDGPDPGAVAAAYNPVNEQVTVIADFESGHQLKQFAQDGGLQAQLDDLESVPSAVVQSHGNVFLLFPDSNPAWIQHLKLGERTTLEITNDFNDIRLLSSGPNDTMYLVDWKETGGDLWEVDTTQLEKPTVASLFVQYDNQETRSRGLTTGVYSGGGSDGVYQRGEAIPHTCTNVGTLYSVFELSEAYGRGESAKPARVPTTPLEDVVGCSYDPVSEELVLFSASKGVLWVGTDGNILEIVDFPGWEIVAGAGYQPKPG